jgi:hypothetical protein
LPKSTKFLHALIPPHIRCATAAFGGRIRAEPLPLSHSDLLTGVAYGIISLLLSQFDFLGDAAKTALIPLLLSQSDLQMNVGYSIQNSSRIKGMNPDLLPRILAFQL